jgi:excisionase family DNA binding protein
LATDAAPSSKLLTRKQAAERLQMSESWLKEQIRRGRLPIVTLGKYVRIDELDLQAFIDFRKHTVGKTVGSPCNPDQLGPEFQATQIIEKTVRVG